MNRKTQLVLKRGFTLIELLVVIAIIALLLSIIMPALSRVKEQCRRVVCSNNAKQMGLGLSLYAEDNKQRFPVDKYDKSHWMWDVATTITDTIQNSGGLTRDGFYCPSFPQSNTDQKWDYCEEAHPDYYNNPFASPYRVTGYSWFIERGTTLSNKNLELTYSNGGYFEGSGKKQFVTKFTGRNSAGTELVADAVLSELDGDGEHSFANINDGWNRTNHIIHSEEPAGGNVLFMDVHVDWRPFERIEKRFEQSNSSLTVEFWW